MVPTGTLRITSAPSRPVLLEPSPWRPRSALYSGLKRKCTKVLWRSLDSMMTSPPSPPSPPDGPPRGTYFSRRKARQPLPPSPAFTRIVASSMNMGLWSFVVGHWSLVRKQKSPGPKARLFKPCGAGALARDGEALLRSDGLNHDVLTQLTPVLEHNLTGDLGE